MIKFQTEDGKEQLLLNQANLEVAQTNGGYEIEITMRSLTIRLRFESGTRRDNALKNLHMDHTHDVAKIDVESRW